MRQPIFRVRKLMPAVGLAALLVWIAVMGMRSYAAYNRAAGYSNRARGMGEISTRRSADPRMAEFHSWSAKYYAQLAAKHRRAMWRPWLTVAPDPHAPGYDLWVEQERHAKAASTESHPLQSR
jgi:hypothetical protein